MIIGYFLLSENWLFLSAPEWRILSGSNRAKNRLEKVMGKEDQSND